MIEEPQIGNYANWVIGGNASVSGNEVILTPDAYNQAGRVWYKNTVDITRDFSFVFDVNLGSSDGGADGITMVFQTQGVSVIGSLGGGLGAEGIYPAMMLEFDTWYNGAGSQNDTITNDHIALHRITNAGFQLWNNQTVDMGNIEDGAYHRVTVDYLASSQTLRIFWDGVRRLSTTANLRSDFLNNSSTAYVGFTAATGAARNLQKVKGQTLTFGPSTFRVDPDDDGRLNEVDADDDGDGLSDVIEGSGSVDSDGDGVPNSLDLDSDNDGINDVREGHQNLSDSNGDGKADGTVGSTGIISGAPNSARDTDSDGTPDYRDLDSDNDSVSDLMESGNSAAIAADTNGDGMLSVADSGVTDTDRDGIMSPVDSLSSGPGDSGDSIPVNTDGDSNPDFRDLDSDGDGKTDLVEAGRNAGTLDPDNDGRIESPQNADSDGDGLANLIDTNTGFGGALPLKPIVTTQAAASIGYTTAVLNASVNPNGGATTGTFTYARNSALTLGVMTTSVQTIGGGTSAVAVNTSVTDLLPHTTYYFRASATNPAGVTNGSILNFTTLNRVPSVTNDLIVSSGTGTLTIPVLSNDSDADGDALTISAVTQGSSGTSSISGSNVRYVPRTGFTGRDSFTYTARDNFGGSAIARVDIHPPLTVATQAATLVGNRTATLNATLGGTGLATTGQFSYSLDPAMATGVIQTTAQSLGTPDSNVTLNATLTGLQPNATYYFRAIGTNALGIVSGSILSFTTTNSLPVAVSDTLASPEGTQPFSVAVLGNDVDSDGDTLRIVSVTAGSLGTVSTNGTTVDYTPGVNFEGNDSFSYTITDGFGGTSSANVTLSRAPSVSTEVARDVLPVSATLMGSATPRGLASSFYFEYGTSSTLATSTSTTSTAIGAGPGEVVRSEKVTGLSPNTRYYFRAVSTSSWGTVRGPIRSFTTPVLVWGIAGSNPVEGKMDATIVPNTTQSPVIYRDATNFRMDIHLTTTRLGSNSLVTVLGEPAWGLEGPAPTSAEDGVARIRFFEPGTTQPKGIQGIRFRLEDAETSERCSDFVYFNAEGQPVPLLWSSSVFRYSHTPRFSAGDTGVENLAPTEGTTQHGKWIEIDLSGIAISGFEFKLKRLSVSGAGSIVMTSLGGANLSGMTVNGSFSPIMVDTDASGTAAVPDYTRQASVSTGEAVTFTQVPTPGSRVSPGVVAVLLTATTSEDQSAVTGFHLQVTDRTAPSISAPASGFGPVTLESTAAVPDYAAQATITDNVGVTRVTQVPAVGSIASLGTTSASLTAVDAKGNSKTLEFPITVLPPSPQSNEVQYASLLATNAGAEENGAPAGATYVSFGIPAINDEGDLAYSAIYKAGALRQTALFAGAPPVLVARIGDPAPGIAGAVFATFNDPCINRCTVDTSAIAFIGTVRAAPKQPAIPANQTASVWTNLGGTLQMIARAGTDAPGAEGATFKSFTSVSFTGGEVVFVATLSGNGVSVANDQGAWHWTAANGLRKILREGQAVTCGFGGQKTLASFQMLGLVAGSPGHGRHHLRQGLHAARLTCTDKSIINCLMTEVDGEEVIEPVAQTGGALFSGLTATAVGLPSGNSQGATAFAQTFATTKGSAATAKDNAAVITEQNGAWQVVARKGDSTDIVGATWGAFADPLLNEDGDLAWSGTLAGVPVASNTAIAWHCINEGTTIVAQKGTAAPGTEGGVFSAFSSVALPSGHCGPVFTATLQAKTGTVSPGPGGVTAADDTGLWAVDSHNTTRLLLREGQIIAGRKVLSFTTLTSVAGSPGQTRSFNSQHSVIVKIRFADNTESLMAILVP